MILSPISLLPFILIFILLDLSSTSQPPTTTTTTTLDDYLKIPLLHTSRSFPFNPSQALAVDIPRVNHLYASLHRHHPHHQRRHRHRQKESGSSAQFPLTSGVSFGTGQYFVSLSLGSPPQPLLLVADTGSDLIWVTCSACRNCTTRRPNSAFFARHSSTFSPFHCFDSACQLVPQPKGVPCNHTRLHSPCRYEYSYSDGSITSGFYGRETTTFNTSTGKQVKYKNLAFGCGFEASGPSITGPSFNGAQGVIGLGLGSISLPSQLGRKFANKFSYCLMDYTLSPTPTSYLLIGGGGNGSGRNSVNATGKSFTPLIPNNLTSTFYYIGIEYVAIDGMKLPISPSAWAIDEFGSGGTVMDSGTTLSFLVQPAYKKVLAEFQRRVKLPRTSKPDPILDFCLNVSGISRPSLPKLSFKLVGGSVFSPPPQNYFIDTAPDVKCLAIQPVISLSGFNLIGNLMQQGFMFEFDRERLQLGFTRHGCALP